MRPMRHDGWRSHLYQPKGNVMYKGLIRILNAAKFDVNKALNDVAFHYRATGRKDEHARLVDLAEFVTRKLDAMIEAETDDERDVLAAGGVEDD